MNDIEEVLEAEKKVKEIIEKASIKSQEILTNARNDFLVHLEKQKEHIDLENKKVLAQKTQEIEKEKEAIFESGLKEVEMLEKKAQKNQAKTISYLAQQVLSYSKRP